MEPKKGGKLESRRQFEGESNELDKDFIHDGL